MGARIRGRLRARARPSRGRRQAGRACAEVGAGLRGGDQRDKVESSSRSSRVEGLVWEHEIILVHGGLPSETSHQYWCQTSVHARRAGDRVHRLARMPVALALHGRLAGWQPTWATDQAGPGRGSSWDIEPHSTLGGFARFVHSTIWDRIVLANRRAGLQLDVYIHSWNPEIGPLLDWLYQPKRSRHDPMRRELYKVASQHLSIKSVLELCAGEVYEHVLVMRHDVIWYEDFVLANLSSAPLWLPHWCLTPQLTQQLGQTLRPACAAEQRGYLGESYLANEPPIASSPQLHMHKFGRAPLRHSAVDQHYIVLDW